MIATGLTCLIFLAVMYMYQSKKEPSENHDSDWLVQYGNDIRSINSRHKELTKGCKAENDKTIDVRISKDRIDINNIPDYIGDTQKQFQFEPSNFDEFIGQSRAKNKMLTILKKIKKNMKSHFFINGIKGHGKTTFAYLLAKEAKAEIIYMVGRDVDAKKIEETLIKINSSKSDNVFWIIDEIETMEPALLKLMNPIIYRFKYNDKDIKPFTFGGITINKFILVKNKNDDFLDRIPIDHHIKFDRYTSKNIKSILKQVHLNLYENELIGENIFDVISINSKFNPRNAISLLESYIVEQNIQKVLKDTGIVKDGLNEIDIKVLKELKEVTKPIGANNLALRVGLNEKEYTLEIEPFLMEFKYIDRKPSRKISEKGRLFLEELELLEEIKED